MEETTFLTCQAFVENPSARTSFPSPYPSPEVRGNSIPLPLRGRVGLSACNAQAVVRVFDKATCQLVNLSTCLALALILAGCHGSYFGPAIEPVSSVEELTALLEGRRQGVDAVQAAALTLKVKGRLEGRGFSRRLTGEGVFTADKARARFSKVIIKGLDVLLDGTYIIVYLPWHEKAYRGELLQLLLDKRVVPSGFVLDPLSFFFPLHRGSPRLIEDGRKYYVVESDAGGGFVYRYYHYKPTGALLKKEMWKAGELLLYFAYDEFADINGRTVPGLLRFGAPASDFRGWLRMRRVALNPTLKETAFRLTLRPGTQIIELAEATGAAHSSTGPPPAGEGPSATEPQ